MLALENTIDDYCIREKISKTWNADDSSIRCLSHIVNLSMKVFLKFLGKTDETSIDDKILTNIASNFIQSLRFIVKKLCSSLQTGTQLHYKESNFVDRAILPIVKI